MLTAENDIEKELSFALRSHIGLNVRDVKSPPVNVDDGAKSEYHEVRGKTRSTRFWTAIRRRVFRDARSLATPAITSILLVMAVAVQDG